MAWTFFIRHQQGCGFRQGLLLTPQLVVQLLVFLLQFPALGLLRYARGRDSLASRQDCRHAASCSGKSPRRRQSSPSSCSFNAALCTTRSNFSALVKPSAPRPFPAAASCSPRYLAWPKCTSRVLGDPGLLHQLRATSGYGVAASAPPSSPSALPNMFSSSLHLRPPSGSHTLGVCQDSCRIRPRSRL
jgi:hypothetical protein